MRTTSELIDSLFEEQLRNWPLAKNNYDSLRDVKLKIFTFENFSVKVQFNPARVQSSSAKIDKESIRERKCFLCSANLPVEQKSVPFGPDYQILVNPYPIFFRHFTIPAFKHVDQLIKSRYADMLDLAESIDRYIIFYNGPRAGASAPDHAHFQAVNRNSIFIEKDIDILEKNIVYKSASTQVYILHNYLRNIFIIKSVKKEESVELFHRIYEAFDLKPGDKEPMMNLFAWYDKQIYITCIFPREKHRPSCFYAEGEEKILVSPGSVDMGGVVILPLEKDFHKITRQDIETIYREVTIPDDKMLEIINEIKAIG